MLKKLGISWAYDGTIFYVFFGIYFPQFFCMMKMGMYWEYDGNYWFTNHSWIVCKSGIPRTKRPSNSLARKMMIHSIPSWSTHFLQTSPQFVNGLETVCEMNSQHLSTQLPTAYWPWSRGTKFCSPAGQPGFRPARVEWNHEVCPAARDDPYNEALGWRAPLTVSI